MAKRKCEFVQGEYYHIYNRGVCGQPIFLSDKNYTHLLQLVRRHFLDLSISIIAYCLMPNHYHFLVRQDSESTVSEFVQCVFNAYGKGFNSNHRRSGRLFEGPFKAKHIDSDTYLLHLCRYIHRNPIDTDPPMVRRLEQWPYSNYSEWTGIRKGSLVDYEFVDDCLCRIRDYNEFIMEEPSLKVKQRLEKYLFDSH